MLSVQIIYGDLYIATEISAFTVLFVQIIYVDLYIATDISALIMLSV